MDAQSAPSLSVLKIKLVLSPPKPASALLPSASVYGPSQAQNRSDVFDAFLSLAPQI